VSSEIGEVAAKSPHPSTRTSAATGLAKPRVGRWTHLHWALLLVALVPLAMAGQGQHFFRDDWAFAGRKLDALPFPSRFLLPHNEHWSLFPAAAYRTLDAVVGVGSYWPYLGLLLLLHLGVTHVLWRIMLVTGSKPIVATALAAVFSVLGAAAEDLVWAFQIGFVGSTLLGLTAIYLAVTGSATWRKTGVLAGLTLASLATSGVGLAYLVVVPLVLTWRQRRYAVATFGLPLLVYLTWYSIYGRALIHPPDASATAPLIVATFVILGLVAALTGYFGFPINLSAAFLVVGVPVLAGLTLACRGWIANRTLSGRTSAAMFAGAGTFFVTAGLARGGLGVGTATSSRYVYVAIALLLPGIALMISGGARRHRSLTRVIVPMAIAIAVSNIFMLFAFAAQTRSESNASMRVLVAASDLVRSSSSIFVDQLPEPVLAPDLTTVDLRSGDLDPAFASVSPARSDRLTASLNLQVQVAPVHVAGQAATCHPTLGQQLTVPASRGATRRFLVSAEAVVAFTLHDVGSSSTPRTMDLPEGIYTIRSMRDTGDLTIATASPASLANC
jgi:hypothetical protein